MAASSAAPSSPALTKDSRPSRTKSRSGHKPELLVLTPQQSHTLSTSTSFSSTTSESTPATASTSATTTAAATPTAASQLSTPGPSTPHHPLRGARSGTRISSSPDSSTAVAMGAALSSASHSPAGGPGAIAAAAAAATTGGAQFHQGTTSYGSHLPPRPYTPGTPSTPTGMQLTIPPLTPPSVAVLTSPRLEAPQHYHHHGSSSSSSGAKSPGLFPFGGAAASAQRVGSISGPSGGSGGGATTRRMPSSESSLYDPYRARQPGVSANRVKNEYHAQSPIRENYAVFPSQHPTTYASTSLGSSSEEDLHHQQHGHHKESLTEEQVFGMMIMHPPPSIGQREDYYRHSPTLTASQTLAANYGNASTSGSSRPESPFQSSPYLPYQSYQPYSHQMPLPSPLTMESGYGLPSPMALASPGLGPFHYSGHEELRSEHKADPYRSAYSAVRDTVSSSGAQGYGSPYLTSGGVGSGAGPQGSPTMMNEDFSSSFESRFSSLSRGGSSANNSRYPLHILTGQDSNQALSSAYYEHQHVHLQQQLQKQQQKAAASAAAASATAAKSAGIGGGSDGKGVEAGSSASPGKGASAHTRQSTQHPSQPSKTDSSGTKKGKTETDEDEENDVILQKLGVISVDSSGSRSGGTRSGLTQGSGRSRRKGQWTDESEEESQERGRPRQRRSMSNRRRRGGRSEDRAQCCCCSRKICIWLSMGLLACLAVSLYFLIPRAPQFSFDSVASQSAPVVTKSRIKEQFSIQLVVDSTSNYLSLRIDRMDVSITLNSMGDDAEIADNDDLDSAFIISPKSSEMVSLPMRLDYRAPPGVGASAMNSTAGASMGNSTDVVYQQLVKACSPIDLDNSTLSSSSSSASLSSMKASATPGLNVVIHGQMHVWGLSWVWKPSFDISVTNLPCPINAPRNPVSELPPGPPTLPTPPAAMASASQRAA